MSRLQLTLTAVVSSLCLVVGGVSCHRDPGPSSENPSGASSHTKPAVPSLDTCLDEGFEVDLLATLDALPDDTPRAQLEQLTDWLWLVLATRLDQPGLLASISQQPLFRDQSLAHVLELPSGSTRSGVAADGSVYLLVRRSTPGRALAEVLERIDHEAMALGELPPKAVVHGVDFDAATLRARVCWLGDFTGDWLRSSASGFRRATIDRPAALAEFLGEDADVLSAACRGGALELNGRRRARLRAAPLEGEHVFALAPQSRYQPLAELGVTAQEAAEIRRSVAATAAQIEQAVAAAVDLRGDDAYTERLLTTVRQWQSEHAEAATVELVASFVVQAGESARSGFSLDPRTDVNQALERLDRLAATLAYPAEIPSLLRSWGSDPSDVLALAAHAGRSPAASFANARNNLTQLRRVVGQAQDPLAAERLLLAAQQGHGEGSKDAKVTFEQLLRQVLRSPVRYQCARYDGPLQGTATAMNLFYTDLLAKLWAMDFADSAPTGIVPGFESVLDHELSAAYCHSEVSRPSTRIWFGPRPDGYVRSDDVGLRFAPIATRLFARGSELGSEHGPEAEPEADMLRFIRWWDRHYGELAAWEPQYERLNQIMKWSLIVQMATVDEADRCPAFLRAMPPVTSDRRFDNWQAEQANLRWQEPLPQVVKQGETTECLAVLESRQARQCGRPYSLSGGVSLAEPEAIRDRPVQQSHPFLHLRRLSPDARLQAPSADRIEIASVEFGTGPALGDVVIETSAGSVRRTADIVSEHSQRAATHLRPDSHRAKTTSKKVVIDADRNGFVVTEEVDDFGTGQLHAQDLHGPMVDLDVAAGPQLEAQMLAHAFSEQLATTGGTLRAAAETLAIERQIYARDDHSVVIGLQSAEGNTPVYAVMQSGGGNRGPPPASSVFHAGFPDRRPAHSGRGSEDPTVRVFVTRDPEAAGVVGAALLREPDGHRLQVRRHLDRGDQLAARQSLQADPDVPVAAIIDVAVAALAAGRRGEVAELAEIAAAKLADPLQLRRLLAVNGRALAEARVRDERQVRRQLAGVELRLGIFARQLDAGETRRAVDHTLRTGAPPTVFGLDSGPREATLPPISHPPDRPPPASERFVLRAIDLATQLSETPAAFVIGDRSWRRLASAEATSMVEAAGVRERTPSTVTTTTSAAPPPPPVPSRIRPPFPNPYLDEGSGSANADSSGADGDGDGSGDGSGDGGGDQQGGERSAWPVYVVLPCEVDPSEETAQDPLLQPCYHDDDRRPLPSHAIDEMWRASAALIACDQTHAASTEGRALCRGRVLQEHPWARHHLTP